MKQRRVRANSKNPKQHSKEGAREAERMKDVGARALHEISAKDDDFEVIYEYMYSEDADERLYQLLERLLPTSELVEIANSTRADSK